MHFIEQFIGVAPDGDSGLLEIVLLTLTLVVSLLAVRWRRDRWSDAPEQKRTLFSRRERLH